MTQLTYYIFALRVFLEDIHTALPAAILVALIWGSQYLVRRFIPNAWEGMANLPFPNGVHRPALALARKAWQALPSIATGALLASLTTGDTTDAVVGAILGALAPIWHEALKALPVPYRGGKPPAADPWQWDTNTPTEPAIARRKSDPPPPETWR